MDGVTAWMGMQADALRPERMASCYVGPALVAAALLAPDRAAALRPAAAAVMCMGTVIGSTPFHDLERGEFVDEELMVTTHNGGRRVRPRVWHRAGADRRRARRRRRDGRLLGSARGRPAAVDAAG